MFSNFGNKVKNFGLRIGSTLSNIAPKALKVGSFITGALSHLPGMIGSAAGVLYKGINAANKVINSLPNSNFKNKLQDLSEKTANTINSGVTKVTPAVKTAQVIGDTGGKIIDAIKNPII